MHRELYGYVAGLVFRAR